MVRVFEREGYVLAIITGVLYLRAYFGILAAANFYDIPMQVMSVDLLQLTQSAIGGLASLSGMATVPLVIYFWFKFGAKKPNVLYFLFMAAVLAVLTFFSSRSEDENAALALAIAVFIFTLILFGFIYFLSRNKSFSDFLVRNFNSDLKDLLSRETVRIYLFAFICIVSLATAYFAVYVTSYSLSNYYVFYKGGYYALINSSADNVVAKKIVNGELADGYFIFKVDALNDIEIKKENIHMLSLPERVTLSPTDSYDSFPFSRI